MMTKIVLALILTAGLTAAAIAATEDAQLKVDLGRVVSTDEVTPVDGVTSAGQPDEVALAVFARSGYTTVIDLRGENEDRGIDEPAVVEKLGMEYISLPIGRDDINFDNAEMLDILIDSSGGPVLVHCGSGNRVGALLALRKSLAGADDEEAIEYGKQGGLTRLEGKVREVLEAE